MEKHATNDRSYAALKAYFRDGRLPHAILVEGTDGKEKDAFVLKIAQGVLCEAQAPEKPCGRCKDCVKADKGVHPDLISYGGEGGARSFHIDAVRAARQQAYIRPNEARGKALVLQNVQNMSVQAQNALLKILEEPPQNVVFILTCENKAALLETVLSRVAVISWEGGELPDESACVWSGVAAEILTDACAGSELKALAALAAYERDRSGLTALLKQMSALLYEAVLRPESLEHEGARRLISRTGRLRLCKILDIIEDVTAAVNRNANGLLLVTALCAGIRSVRAEE